jgi:hypothetical protein
MDKEVFRQAMIEIGRRGGLARAKAMTREQRRKSALKASRAAAIARMKRAKTKKAAQNKK